MTAFEDLIKKAEKEIAILGTNSLIPYLENSAKTLTDLLTLNEKLTISIYYESDNENFNQSLCLDTPNSKNRISYSSLNIHRDRIKGHNNNLGLKHIVKNSFDTESEKESVEKRFSIFQVNLRLPVNVLICDSKLYYCFVTNNLPTIEDYKEVTDDKMKDDLLNYYSFYTDKSNSNNGSIYLSNPSEELIQLYDKQSYPRGIFPRSCFYTTEYKRYSVWGFVFNRKGQLLLHKRSENKTTKDNRGLWDKSIGGHVNILDQSSFVTAKNELIEELFLPNDIDTKHLRADLGDIVNFGDWNISKRGEIHFREAFASLSKFDWVLFGATDNNGDPLSISRVSNRRFHEQEDKVKFIKTIFMSDIYFFIAPEGYLDTDEQMKDLVKLSEKTGAASDHKLVSIDELRNWIKASEEENIEMEMFTDDLLFINVELRPLLEKFSEFVKHIF
jgi:hypothetical protein